MSITDTPLPWLWYVAVIVCPTLFVFSIVVYSVLHPSKRRLEVRRVDLDNQRNAAKRRLASLHNEAYTLTGKISREENECRGCKKGDLLYCVHTVEINTATARLGEVKVEIETLSAHLVSLDQRHFAVCDDIYDADREDRNERAMSEQD